MNYQDMLNKISTIQELHKLKSELIGDKGSITQKVKTLANLSIEQKRIQGNLINEEKELVKKLIKDKEAQLKRTNQEVYDHALFDSSNQLGLKHIITESIELLDQIFEDVGFTFYEGPDIETSYYNFDALNMPFEHPARDNNDTFYMNNEKTELLRTQVTSVQVHVLEDNMQNNNDIRAYSIGNVFRNDTHDATHSCQFQQIEGIIVEKGVTIRHLKGFLEYILENFFQKKLETIFRPSFFPFTEPSCEVYMSFSSNKQNNLLEIGGCGIIHESILKTFNKEKRQAFAFGLGLERLIMLKYGIKNIHTLYNNKMPELSNIK